MPGTQALPLEHARAAFLAACALDVATPKPGNVSTRSPGHGMDAAQFLASADASLDALFARGARVGRRILDAVTRTRAAVGCNTNLGIVLLVAPLAAALDEPGARPLSAPAWRAAVADVLSRLDVEDARLAYRAIALANPGGLGDAPEQSVHAPPTVDLREAMRLASARDSIARQYANGFADLFDTGLAAYREAAPKADDIANADARDSARDGMPKTADETADETAMLNVFLAFLGGWPDSHIVRKHGLALAQSVTLMAREQQARRRETPPAARRAASDPKLDAWDDELKAQSINPGTSADLAVATLFVARCLDARG
jgi:triphosphoribosyl-dephospho-CoA synthase